MKHPLARCLAATATVGAALIAASPAAAAPVPASAGSLDWSIANVYDSGAPKDTNRTWLGYLTTLAGKPSTTSAQPLAPATGDTVTTDSPKGPDQSYGWDLPLGSGGSYDAETGDADVELGGGVRFTGAGHNIDVTIQDPHIVIDGDTKTGAVYASGTSQGTAFGRTTPVLTLKLDTATTTTADRVTTIAGIVPQPGRSDVFQGYTPNSPVRTPNIMGLLTLSITEAPSVTVSKTTGITAGDAVTVTGSRFKSAVGPKGDLDAQGYYAALVGPDFDTSDRDTPTGSSAFVPGAAVAADGSWSTTLTLSPTFGTGASAVDCLAVRCRIAVWRAHRDADPSQRVAVPVTFSATAPPTDGGGDGSGGTTPGTGGGTTPATGGTTTTTGATTTGTTGTTPAAGGVQGESAMRTAAPRVRKARLSRTRLTFRVGRAGTVSAKVQKRVVRRVKGRKVLRWKTLRTLEVEARKAGTYRLNPRLGKRGTFRVVLRPVGVTGTKGKAVVVRKRVR